MNFQDIDIAVIAEMLAKYTVANVTLVLFCAAVTLVLAGHLLLGGSKKTRLDRLFTRILILHAIMLVSAAAAWAFNGVTQPDLRILIIVANYIEFSLNYINAIFLTDYIVTTISEKRKISRWIVHIVAIVGVSCAAAITVSLFNGIVFYIDGQNLFRIGPYYMYVHFAGPAMVLFFSIVVVYYSKHLGRSNTITFLSYIIFLIATALLLVVFPELVLYYAAFTLSMLITYVNIHIRREKTLKDKELELADARISIMISQIQPHFLYNTLSVVGDLCRHDPETARETVIEFSHYLRANLAALTQKETIPFKEEMKHVDTYLSLEKKRFGRKIRVEYILNAGDFCLPPLTLQPIVENAVLHGVTAREEGGNIVIMSDDIGEAWQITITDDGVGFDSTEERRDGALHVGIQNVRFRVETMCGGSLEVRSEPGGGTEAVIVIPKRNTTD